MRILSLVENEINLSKPFIEVTTKSDQLFLVSAFEGQGKKIGHFPIESRGCTRAFGDTGFGTVDLRGKKIRLGTGACKSRLEVANW